MLWKAYKGMLQAPVGDDVGGGSGGGEGAPTPGAEVHSDPSGSNDGGGADPGDHEYRTSDDDAGGGREAPNDADERGESRGGGERQAPRGRGSNAIPHERVREMLTVTERRAYERAQAQIRKELEPLMAQLDPEKMRRGLAEQLVTALGMEPKKPAPKYLTEEQLAAREKALEAKFESRWTQEQQQRQVERETYQAQRELDSVKAANAELFEDYPDLEEEIANAWGSPRAVQERLSVTQIANAKIAKLKAAIGKVNARQSGERQERAAVTPIRPGSSANPRAAGKGPDLKTDEGVSKAAVDFLRKRMGK